MALAQWLDLTGALWCHTPNGGARDARTGAWLKRQGVKPGVPDVLLFDLPDTERLKGVVGIAIELKAPSGRPTLFQQQWIDRLTAAGWLCFVARSAQEGIKWLMSLGYSPRATYRRTEPRHV